jgi:hypothetical protein
MKRGAKINWTKDHDLALTNLKLVYSSDAMGYFNRSWITVLTTDASPTGLGAVLSKYDPEE